MKVRCIANTGSALLRESLDAGDSVNAQFPIDIGEIYTVYGVSLWKGTMNYLVDLKGSQINVLSRPDWNPAELFEIVDSRLPAGWHFDFRGQRKDYPLKMIYGYPELLDEKHYNALIDADTREDADEALLVFLQRKREADKLYEREETYD